MTTAEAEDYRVKNAREGKAIYIAGKDKRDWEAMQERRKAPQEVKLNITQEEASGIHDKLDEVVYLYSNAANVFEMISTNISTGALSSDDPGLSALCELCAIAFKQKAETSGVALGAFGQNLVDETLKNCMTAEDCA